MANAKKCDRCGDLYEMYDGIKFEEKVNLSYNHIHVLTNHDSVHKTFDLCPICMNKLINFLEMVDDKEFKRCFNCKYNSVKDGGCTRAKTSDDLCSMNYEHWEAKDDGSD